MTVQLTDVMELSGDVELTPIADLPDSLREGLGGYVDGYTVSRPLGRMKSRVVDGLGAALIESFRQPSRLVDAILTLSQAHEVDPHELLEESLPLIAQLVADEVLVEEGHVAPVELTPTFRAGAHVGGTELVRPMYLLEDTEVYRATGASGEALAVKVYRAPVRSGPRRAFERELEVLEHLGGVGAPALVTSGTEDEMPYIVEEWCEGLPVAAAMSRLTDPNEVAELAASVVDTYSGLHQRGVLHGDVHPGNVIVGEDGAARLIDFGQATLNGKAGARGGVIAYYEPEMARALQSGRLAPPPTERGEQYALAAILFEAITGQPAVQLPIGQKEALAAIVEDEPPTFAELGRAHLAGVEPALRRALAKSASGRFADMASFAAALRASVSPRRAEGPKHPPIRARLARLGLLDIESAALDSRPPNASVFYGAAGISLALLRAAQALDDPELLAMSHLWIDLALSADGETGYLNADYGLDAGRLQHGSPFHGLAGTYAVRAQLADAEGDLVSLGNAVGSYLDIIAKPETGFDPTLERPAALWGLIALRRLRSLTPPMVAHLDEQIEASEAEVLELLQSRPAIAADFGAPMGAAHGYAGVIHALLQAATLRGVQPDRHVTARLDELADLAHQVPTGTRWPWFVTPDGSLGRSMAGWCNGSAGMVGLWLDAARHWDEERARALAGGAGDDVWQDPSQIGNLCCGSAGRAFALLRLYQDTGDELWYGRATDMVQSGLRLGTPATGGDLASVPRSLFKGEIGLAVAEAALIRPQHQRMPMYG